MHLKSQKIKAAKRKAEWLPTYADATDHTHMSYHVISPPMLSLMWSNGLPLLFKNISNWVIGYPDCRLFDQEQRRLCNKHLKGSVKRTIILWSSSAAPEDGGWSSTFQQICLTKCIRTCSMFKYSRLGSNPRTLYGRKSASLNDFAESDTRVGLAPHRLCLALDKVDSRCLIEVGAEH